MFSSISRLFRCAAALTFAAALVASVFAGAPSARAAETTCSGTLGGNAFPATQTNIKGNVKVPDHASCTLYFVDVTGSIEVGQGSTLVVNGYNEPSTIEGNIVASQCTAVLLEGTITVGGDVQISYCVGSTSNGFVGPDVVIDGSFLCQGNSSSAAPCLAQLGRVHGDVVVNHNMSPVASDVSLVDIGGSLLCTGNSVKPTHTHGPDWVNGSVFENQCNGFSTTKTSIGTHVTPVRSCAALTSLPAGGFPVPNTVIDSAIDSAASSPTTGLPETCIVNGHINKHASPVDNCTYQIVFQVQLPLPSAWNGRFMFQGGGGTEGSVPNATGTDSGSGGANYGIENGYAVASQNGGHNNADLVACATTNPATDGNVLEFYLDPLGTIGQAFQSIEVTAITAKYLINVYYGDGPQRSYWVGCSTGGRQGMVMSQRFPSFFDGIVAGDPVYNQEALALSEVYGIEQFLNAYLKNPALTPPGPTEEPQAAPEAPAPHLYPGFPSTDQGLFETALLQACDALDGVTDGVIDNLPACWAKFNPSSATYVDYAGALGPANTVYHLQCTGAKNATCLSQAQIQAAIKTNQGPRTSKGKEITAPATEVAEDNSTPIAQGYAYDGGWMTTVGIPARKIGSSSANSVPGDFSGNTASYFGYAFLTPPSPSFDALAFDFDTQMGMVSASTPIVTNSTSLDIERFVNYGHKIIWYHGLSDPGPPVLGTIKYYEEMADQFGGLDRAQRFSRFYPVPNMDHCTGGATTDNFHMLAPLTAWVENGTAPGPINATGTNFNAATYQVVGNYVTDTFVNAPTTRSRPLCPYPQQARFTGSRTVVQGVPVAVNPADLGQAANYTCVQPPNGN